MKESQKLLESLQQNLNEEDIKSKFKFLETIKGKASYGDVIIPNKYVNKYDTYDSYLEIPGVENIQNGTIVLLNVYEVPEEVQSRGYDEYYFELAGIAKPDFDEAKPNELIKFYCNSHSNFDEHDYDIVLKLLKTLNNKGILNIEALRDYLKEING